MKNNLRKIYSKFSVVVPGAMMLASVPVFAEDTVATTMGTALSGMQTDFLAVVAVVAVPALGIYAVPKVWKLGLRFFSAITGRG